jgi:hypothetical protein
MNHPVESSQPSADPDAGSADEQAPAGSSSNRESRQQGADERSAPAGDEVYGAIEKEGESELKRSNSGLAWSGLAAGMSMGFSMVTQALLTKACPLSLGLP